MTRDELARYRLLSREVEKQERRMERLRTRRLSDIETDLVKGSMQNFPYIEKKIKIAGSPVGLIKIIEEEIRRSVSAAMDERIKIEKFINDVQDPQLRELLRSRFIDCLSWAAVGRENCVTPDHARKLVRNFLKQAK